MLSKEQIENIKRNFEAESQKVLTAQAHDMWKPIIIQLLDEHTTQSDG